MADSEASPIILGDKTKKMTVSFPRFPRWLCGGGSKDKGLVSNDSPSTPSCDTIKIPTKTKPSSKRTRRRWLGREEEKIDKAVFPEPEGPEWSIGWVEPHGPEFRADGEEDGGFMVLVPCYKKVVKGSSNQLLDVTKNFPDGFSPDGKSFMEQWLSSLQKSYCQSCYLASCTFQV